MVCPNCGTENQGHFKFCTECGFDFSTLNASQNNTTEASAGAATVADTDAAAINEAKEILQQAAGSVDMSGLSREDQKKAVLMQAAKEIAAGKIESTGHGSSVNTAAGAAGSAGTSGDSLPSVLAIISLVMGILCIPCMCISLLKHPAYQLFTILCATICGLFALIKGYQKKAIPIIGMALGCISFFCWLVVVIFG